jgi:hypothetical protein
LFPDQRTPEYNRTNIFPRSAGSVGLSCETFDMLRLKGLACPFTNAGVRIALRRTSCLRGANHEWAVSCHDDRDGYLRVQSSSAPSKDCLCSLFSCGLTRRMLGRLTAIQPMLALPRRDTSPISPGPTDTSAYGSAYFGQASSKWTNYHGRSAGSSERLHVDYFYRVYSDRGECAQDMCGT